MLLFQRSQPGIVLPQRRARGADVCLKAARVGPVRSRIAAVSITISPGESQFSKIHFSTAKANDLRFPAQFRGGDFLKARNGNVRGLSGPLLVNARQFRPDETNVPVKDPVHNWFPEEPDRGVAVFE